MIYTPLQLSVIAFCALFIGVSKSGFAGSAGMLATPLLAMVIGGENALGLLLPILLSADVFNLYHFWRKWDPRALAMILPGCIAGVFLGWPLLKLLKGIEGGQGLLDETVGLVAVVFALIQIGREWAAAEASPFQPTWHHGAFAGGATGLASTLAHQGGLVTQMYFLPQKLDAATFVGNTTIIYFFTNLAKIPVYASMDLLSRGGLILCAYLLPVVFAGTAIGTWLNKRMSSRLFNRIILVFVLLAGLKLLLWN